MRGYIFVVISCASLGLAISNEDTPGFRLPNNAVPNSYNIKIEPNIMNGSFYGEVTIYVELQQSVKFISLNIKDLAIESLVLDNYKDQTTYKIDEKYELIHISHADMPFIDPGEHMIHVKYTGVMRMDSIGLFRSVIESQGRKFISAATMFSAPYARMVFPCFDEPAYKSRFTIRLVEPDATFTALSNMEKIGSYEIPNGIAVDFQTTPPISPYIVCFAFTQYKYESSTYLSRDGRVISLRFFLVDEYLDQAPFLLEVAKNALQFFEEYTNVTYPISKLDFIEVPDFIFEGMENIGLVILTHNSVSYNASSKKSKIQHLRNAAQLVVHEISHMWFGDIVTPKWYNDLWLAEGFAELMEIKGLHHQYPQWQLEGLESVLRRERIFYNDNAPIINFPENNDQVEEQFGDITYTKGCAVLTMLEMVMGENVFREGVRLLQKNFYWKSATTGNFVNIMQSVSPLINIRGFLETWLHQDRFPLVIVSKDNNSYILRQESLVTKPNTSSIYRRKWTIPITFVSSCNKSHSLNWFDRDADSLRIPSCGEKWIKFNHRAMSFYRVLYTEEQYEQLLRNFDNLEEVDRANLIAESFQLFAQRKISCAIPLKFVGALKKRKVLLPSLVSFNIFPDFIRISHENRSVYDKMRSYFIETFKDLYEELTWKVNKEDGYIERQLRFKLLKTMCLPPINYEKCLKDADKVKAEEGKIHPDIFFVWKSLTELKTRKKGLERNTSRDVNNTTYELHIEKCMSWIKLNL